MRKDFRGFLTASATVKVPFNDLDPAGVVWHGRYFKYLESARCALLESLDYSYDGMKDSGFLWPVVDSRIRYLLPFTLGQTITITACLSEWEFRLAVDYRLDDEQGRVCTRARTVQVPVEAVSMELQLGCPPVLVDRVESAMRQLRSGNN